ncbi:MAG: glycoside hydrolase family 15 protein [Deltaproteobacteria bacterium]|nr:glycoside hydrolase family 15 protein [Deltaproteobacteria bacterium]
MATLLEDYGLIGDSTTLALISRDGSLDWMCLPRVDSDACFARLLGTDAHGYWKLRPAEEVLSIRQRYLPETLVLETEMTCTGGKVRLVDFMPPGDSHHDVVRIVEGVEGEVAMHLDLKVRFAYGKLNPWIQLHDHQATLTAGPDALAFSSPVELVPDWDEARLEAHFTVRPGQRLPFTLAYYPSHELRQHIPVDAERELARTVQHWQTWAGHCRYEGPYRDAVIRSFITLKALTYQPTGGILAAATTSVPEELGGVRNWDYRFCWLRDATFTLDALMLGGYHEEAHAWRDWLLRAIAGAPSQAQIMYGIAGRHRLTETTLPWLPGYEGSAPVRIGNAAYDQFQLDIYGEVLNSLYEARTHGIGQGIPILWNLLVEIVDFVEKNWQRTDEGIWEIRSDTHLHFTHSKLMAWVAMDRGVKFGEQFGHDAPERLLKRLNRWRATREEIRRDILARAYNARLGAFTQSYGSDALDASVLLISMMGLLPANDPRMVSTVAAIEKDLTVDGYVLRYATETGVDGLPGDEATFLICTYWLADNLIMQGKTRKAQGLFEKLLSIRSQLGLLAEEYHPRFGRQLGNYPQAYSHVGLIFTAFLLEAQRKGQELEVPSGAELVH